MDLERLRRSAAELTAAAVNELYPDAELIENGPTPTGFFCEFFFPHPIHSYIIEEKMKQIIREKRPIRILEMVPFSASELLLSQGQPIRAEAVPDEDLVQVVQIGAFHNLSPGPHLKNVAEIAAFKIKAEPLPEKRMRITGWCHTSKDALKKFLKQLDGYKEPSQIGEALGFWKGDVWYPPGIRAREKLIQFLKLHWFQGAFEIAFPLNLDPFEVHRMQNRPKVASIDNQMRVSFFNLSEQEMISCLQLIGKTLTIMGFDHSISSVGFEAEDGIGRRRILVALDKRGNDLQISARIESILELMLEKNLMGVLENK